MAAALAMARAGDLLVIFGDDITRCWKQIISFEGDETASHEEKKPVVSYAQEAAATFKLDPEAELIRDERGVRIARQDPEDSD